MENKTITLSESEFFKIVREAISEEIEINPKNIGVEYFNASVNVAPLAP